MLQETTSIRSMEQQSITPPTIKGRYYIDLVIMLESNMAEKRPIQNLIDCFAVVYPAIGDSVHAINRRFRSGFCHQDCSSGVQSSTISSTFRVPVDVSEARPV